MKFLIAPLAALVLSYTASGGTNTQIAVYRGTSVTKAIQGDSGGTKIVKTIEVVDLATGDSVVINLGKSNGMKTFSTADVTSHLITTVTDSRASKVKEYAVLANAFQGEAQGTDSVQARVLKGKKAGVVLRGDTTSMVAKTLSGKEAALFAGAALFDVTYVLDLDVKISKEANDANDTLAEAVNRVEDALVASGYQRPL